ncbi:MAG: hypothetical protein U0931_13810 [Vulcanimicrobiota bacterium]
MNTLDLLYRIYRARYSLDVLQRRLDTPVQVVFLGEHSDTERMLQWLGELHPQASEIPIEQRQWPVEADAWEKVSACVIHLGSNIPSLELLRERAEEIPDSVPCLWVVENVEGKMPDFTAGTLPQVQTLDPLNPGHKFRAILPRAFPSLATRLARDYSSLRYSYARQMIRRTATRNARMALASTLAAPPIPGLNTIWKFFATTGETIAITATQIHLCLLMAALHFRSLDFFDRMGELWPVIGGSFGWRRVARLLVSLVPGLGWLSKGTLAYSGTFLIGETSRLYYEYGQPNQEELLREIKRRSQDEMVKRLKDVDADLADTEDETDS